MCGTVFDEHDAYRVHLNAVHSLFDDPGTESRLPELIEILEQPAEPEPATPRARPVTAGPSPTGEVTGPSEEAGPVAPEAPLLPVGPMPAGGDASGAAAQEAHEQAEAEAEAEDAVAVRNEPARSRTVTKAVAVAATIALAVAAGVSLQGSSPPEAAEPPADASSAPSPAPAPEPAPEDQPPGTETYVVQRGDTLSDIAAGAGLSVGVLAAENGLHDPNLIYPGQVLRLPTGG